MDGFAFDGQCLSLPQRLAVPKCIETPKTPFQVIDDQVGARLKHEGITRTALDDDPHPADKIYKTGKEMGVDMIILGSKGRTSAAAFLIGSVAEKLVMENSDIPLLLVKKGKENLGFLDALFKL